MFSEGIDMALHLVARSSRSSAGAQINTAADEFCPSPGRNGHSLLFVSTRGCGGADIYARRRHAKRGWAVPENLGCGANSAADEASPFVVGGELYFSSTRPGGFAHGGTDSDIYVSPIDEEGLVGTPVPAPGLNTASSDARQNLSRDGLEIFFDSSRPVAAGNDIYSSTRASTSDAWSTPANLGANVNSALAETRPSLSWDGTTLYFGSNRVGGEGDSDLYVTTRERVPAGG